MSHKKELLIKVINNGCSPNYDLIKNKRVRMSNQIYLSVLVYTLPFVVINLFYSYYPVLLLYTLNLVVTFFSLYLCSKKRCEQSNALFLHTLIGGLFFYYVVLGAASRVDVILIAVMSGVYTIYGSERVDKVIYYMSLCVFVYIGMYVTEGFTFLPFLNPVESYVSYIRVTSFLVTGLACVMVPIMFDMENKERERKLALAKEKSEQLLKKRTTFFSMMSHEIRTPLHGIIGLSELLTEKRSLPQSLLEKLSVINFSAQNLKNIVSDILDYSKLEEGRLTISKSSINLHNLIKDIDNIQGIRVKNKGLEFIKNIPSGLPEFVESDPFRLTQVISNLIDNALKFTAVGSISLNIKFDNQGDDLGELTFEIKDTGVGIPKDAQSSIFQPYAQVDPIKSRNYNGTGLGLTICKQIINQLDGEVELNSIQGEGTSMKFKLPVKVLNPTRTEHFTEGGNRVSPNQLLGLRILQVEDNLINQFVCEEVFKSLGITYEIANNGGQALKILENEVFDMLIMDYHMPDMDGYEVSQKVRDLESSKNKNETPILIATADSEGLKKLNYDKYGINGHLVKPFSKTELLKVLGYYCEKFEINLTGKNSRSRFSEVDFSGPQIDYGFIKDIVGDEATANQLVEMVRESVPKYIGGINAYRSITISTKEEKQDFISKVHNLKSNFRNIGAKNFSQILQVAEDCLRQDRDEEVVWEAISLVEKNLHLLEIN